MSNGTRVFPGHATRQLRHDGLPADGDAWYWEPADYHGDVLWNDAFPTREEAEASAREFVDAGGEQ